MIYGDTNRIGKWGIGNETLWVDRLSAFLSFVQQDPAYSCIAVCVWDGL